VFHSEGTTKDDRGDQLEVPSPLPPRPQLRGWKAVSAPGLKGVPSLCQKPLRHLQSYHRCRPGISSQKIFSKRQTGSESVRMRIARSEKPHSTRAANRSHLRNPHEVQKCSVPVFQGPGERRQAAGEGASESCDADRGRLRATVNVHGQVQPEGRGELERCLGHAVDRS